MAEVTVNELATSIGAPVERLLAQMQEAGLSHKKATDKVSDEEKASLLAHIKGGQNDAEPRKITLQRKTTTTLKTGTGSA